MYIYFLFKNIIYEINNNNNNNNKFIYKLNF